ncbi:aspartic proteinase nepenthesin-2 [Ziziphus jujuba]|uniref:Aspartic proteinase nepenthesin-2 n=1 Tax=Ziziphus jujuba TaxID=326968 RepID=A0A6P4BHW2_ZIZJJ|nr:aspartic proteinase nepenthesin-2 [Ziziphus jujuba]
MTQIQPFMTKITLLLCLTAFFQFHFTSSKPIGFSLKLIPRDSPNSPLYQGNLTKHERMQRLINITQAKAHYLQYKSSPNSSIVLENIRFTMIRDIFYFAVHVSIGNPIWQGYLLMDTGGGLIWTQCEPCISCFHLEYDNDDPRASSSYSRLPCDHPLCQAGLYQCVNGQCIYEVTYGGGDHDEDVRGLTQGYATLETFKFNTMRGGDPVFINDIIFGCSNDNQGFRFGADDNIAGVMGMSMSLDSLVSQLSDRIEKKFSYCLPSMLDEIENDILLNFGSDIPIPQNLQSTPFVTPAWANPYFYLNLLDISVGQDRIGFPPGTFQVSHDGTQGFFIDSGFPITTLNQNAYGTNVYLEVMNKFQAHYDSHKLERSSDSPHGFELCYEQPHDFHDFLTMTYHFERFAEYVVHSNDAHFFDELYDIFCVAILPGSGPSILGAFHQQNKRIIYNLNDNVLQFVTETCPF